MPAAIFEAKPRPSMVSAKVPCTSSQARTQREQTMHFAGSNWKYGLEPSTGDVQMVGAVVAVAHLAQRRPRRRHPAIRNCRWRSRSGSRADGRRCTAPSRRGAAGARFSVAVCDLHARRDRRGAGGRRAGAALDLHQAEAAGCRSCPAMSVAQSFGTLMPASIAARMIEVPSGTVTSWPSMVSVTVFVRRDVPACRSRVSWIRGIEDHLLCRRGLAGRRRDGARRKSSGKCVSALITGYGMNPPSAHSEPNFIVWQRSRSSSRFASTARRP